MILTDVIVVSFLANGRQTTYLNGRRYLIFDSQIAAFLHLLNDADNGNIESAQVELYIEKKARQYGRETYPYVYCYLTFLKQGLEMPTLYKCILQHSSNRILCYPHIRLIPIEF
jgi:hypothetical protein